MGGQGSGRLPSAETLIARQEQRVPVANEMFLPNYSGVKPEALKTNPSTLGYTDAEAVSAVAAADDYLKNSEADEGVGLTLSGDNSSADTAYVPMILYNTDATPPAANTVPIGTIYIQYTA